MRHHTKDKGDIAVGQVIADLLQNGARVFLPLSEHLPCDLIAASGSMKELRRVQVKYLAASRGILRLDLRSTHSDRHGVHRKRIELEEIDAFAVFCPDTSEVYYVLRHEIPEETRTRVSLRLASSKNGQIKRIKKASDFVGASRIFGPVAQWTEQRISNPSAGGSSPSGPAIVS